MKKIKMFCHGDFDVFEDKINDFLKNIIYESSIEIQYETGSVDGDFLFTAMIIYNE